MSVHVPGDEPRDSHWLAYELHDGLLQWVVGARYHLTAALSRTNEEFAESETLRGALRSLDMALVEGRELIRYLEQDHLPSEPALAAELVKFVNTIRSQAEFANQQIVTDFDPKCSQLLLDHSTCWNLLRIVQQAVQNAIRHAGPTQIVVACRISDDGQRLELSVQDQGCGFDVDQQRPGRKRYGLASMAHRAKLIGATLKIHSSLGGGCRIDCTKLLRP